MAKPTYTEDERLYLQMMQSNIERMANNSANCKTWLITMVAGFMALSVGINELHWWLLIALVPIGVFWYLDSFYLSLERGMRNRQKDFLNKQPSEGTEYNDALYNFKPLPKDNDDSARGFKKTKSVWTSKTVLPFYLILMLIIIAVTLIINWQSLHHICCC